MPLRSIKYVILGADSRPLEVFISAYTVVWSAWLLSVKAGIGLASATFVNLVNTQGGLILWGLGFMVAGLFQAAAVWLSYPRLKRYASSVSCIFWTYAAICMALAEPRIFYHYMAGMMALGEFMLVIHKNAINSPKEGKEGGSG